MPFFATGLHYSSTGNALEGMQTPSYNATMGMYNRITQLLWTQYVGH